MIGIDLKNEGVLTERSERQTVARHVHGTPYRL
jgi:hypothetical protein